LWKRSFQSSIQFKSMQKKAAWLHGQESTSAGAATPGADREKDHPITDCLTPISRKLALGLSLN
jgi:hypothetical protein